MDAVTRRSEAIRLLSQQAWFALATLDDDGYPTISYIPYALVGKTFGIVASRLAAHYAPLLAKRPVSLLLVDTQTESSDAYTRARFSIGVTATPHAAQSTGADAIWTALERRQGETVRTLRTLPDFQAISLEPISGRLVLGFASASDLSASAVMELLENAN